jgi:hypothetical protein
LVQVEVDGVPANDEKSHAGFEQPLDEVCLDGVEGTDWIRH